MDIYWLLTWNLLKRICNNTLDETIPLYCLFLKMDPDVLFVEAENSASKDNGLSIGNYSMIGQEMVKMLLNSNESS